MPAIGLAGVALYFGLCRLRVSAGGSRGIATTAAGNTATAILLVGRAKGTQLRIAPGKAPVKPFDTNAGEQNGKDQSDCDQIGSHSASQASKADETE